MTTEEASRAAGEAVKKNTDCIYFLASPLTCKKGSDCEFRHLEGARVNPRDCRYWLSGNCLNPNCLFRHPPLEGMIGNPKSTPSQTPDQVSATLASSKQKTPCYYFQKGSCLKGDRCPFFHVPEAIKNPNPIPQSTAKAAPAPESQNPSKAEASKIIGLPQRFPANEKISDANGSTLKVRKVEERLKESSSDRGNLISEKVVINGRHENSKQISHGEIDGSDLRFRLLRKRKGEGEGEGEDFRHSRRVDDEDRRHRGRVLPGGSSLSGRLGGRVSLPGRSSSDFQRDEDREMARRAQRIPTMEAHPRLNVGMDVVQSQDSTFFEGPKPLSEILKRKREAAAQKNDKDGAELKVKGSPELPKVEEKLEETIEEGELAPETECLERREEDWEFEAREEEIPQPEVHSPRDMEEVPEAEEEFPTDDMEDAENTGEFGEDEIDDEDGDDFARKIGIIFS